MANPTGLGALEQAMRHFFAAAPRVIGEADARLRVKQAEVDESVRSTENRIRRGVRTSEHRFRL